MQKQLTAGNGKTCRLHLFNLSFKSLSLSQWQQVGAVFIGEGKNIFITFLVAEAVLNGRLALGAM